METESPSGSLLDPLHVSVLSTVGVDGARETVAATGGRLVSVRVAESVALSPLGSCTVAAHVMVSLREAMVLDKLRVAVLPRVLPVVVLVHT